MSNLKPCPFCGCDMEIVSVGRDWFRIRPVDGHDDFCPFGENHEWDCSQGNPEWKNEHITDWNTRHDNQSKREAAEEILALHEQDRAKVNSQCDTLINMSTVDKYLRGLE